MHFGFFSDVDPARSINRLRDPASTFRNIWAAADFHCHYRAVYAPKNANCTPSCMPT